MFPALWSCRVSDAGAIHGAEQETSVRQSNVATRYSLSLRVRKTGLCAAEVVDAGGGGANTIREGVDPPLAAYLETVATTYEHCAQDCRRLVENYGIKG